MRFSFLTSAYCRTGKELLNVIFLLGSEISKLSLNNLVYMIRLEPRKFLKLVKVESSEFLE